MVYFTIFGIILTIVSELCLVDSIPTQHRSPKSLISLQLPTPNPIQPSAPTNHSTRPFTSTDYSKTIYSIPHSSFTLTIFSNPVFSMQPAAIQACLGEVVLFAHAQPPNIPFNTPFQHLSRGNVRFKLNPASWIDDFTWSIVVVVVSGLLGYMEESGHWRDSIAFIYGAGRGEMGSFSVSPNLLGGGHRDTVS